MKKYDVSARIGSYTDAQGNEKGRWLTCGAVFETEKGLSMKLEAVPVGSEWNGFFSLFAPKGRDANTKPQGAIDETPPAWQDNEIPNF